MHPSINQLLSNTGTCGAIYAHTEANIIETTSSHRKPFPSLDLDRERDIYIYFTLAQPECGHMAADGLSIYCTIDNVYGVEV